MHSLVKTRKHVLPVKLSRRLIEWLLAARIAGQRALVHHEDGFNPEEEHHLLPRRNWARRILLRMVRALVVPSMTLAKIAERLKKKGVALKVLDQSIDTSTSEGKLMFHMLGAFAEFENDIRRERQQDGIAKAQANGVKFGRKPVLSDEQTVTIRRLREDEGFTIAQLMERFQIGRTTVYRALGSYSN